VIEPVITGNWLEILPIRRRSWLWWWISIKFPAQINRRALNSAWVTKWKNAISGIPSPKVNIIRATWLNVDRAIIFFMSHSAIALALAINMVIVATTIRVVLIGVEFIRGKNRIRRNTPAVTRVEECTRALTGVGAAIAAGNHLEKGICALFVMAATRINRGAHLISSSGHMLVMFHCP